MHYCSLNTIYNVKSSGVKRTIVSYKGRGGVEV